ncbi:hypothetical protein [Nocardia sp. NPDC049526]|uniref:hypothetical protein n=1 Tax=Nocardia sp. NPDC049526 TaxID=3364316 RepID=UPI0037BB2B8C
MLLQVDVSLFELVDALVERVDVGGCAEPGSAPGLLAERFGQSFLQLLDAGSKPAACPWAASRSACNEARGPQVHGRRWRLDLLAAHGFSPEDHGAR